MYQPNYLVIPDDAAQVVYVAIRNGNDEAVKHILRQGFEPTDGFPGVTFSPEWDCFIKRLFTEEAA